MVDLKSAKEFKIKGLEALGIKELGADLPGGLSPRRLENGQFFINQAESDYRTIIACASSNVDRNTAYEQCDRCRALLLRITEYRNLRGP